MRPRIVMIETGENRNREDLAVVAAVRPAIGDPLPDSLWIKNDRRGSQSLLRWDGAGSSSLEPAEAFSVPLKRAAGWTMARARRHVGSNAAARKSDFGGNASIATSVEIG